MNINDLYNENNNYNLINDNDIENIKIRLEYINSILDKENIEIINIDKFIKDIKILNKCGYDIIKRSLEVSQSKNDNCSDKLLEFLNKEINIYSTKMIDILKGNNNIFNSSMTKIYRIFTIKPKFDYTLKMNYYRSKIIDKNIPKLYYDVFNEKLEKGTLEDYEKTFFKKLENLNPLDIKNLNWKTKIDIKNVLKLYNSYNNIKTQQSNETIKDSIDFFEKKAFVKSLNINKNTNDISKTYITNLELGIKKSKETSTM